MFSPAPQRAGQVLSATSEPAGLKWEVGNYKENKRHFREWSWDLQIGVQRAGLESLTQSPQGPHNHTP